MRLEAGGLPVGSELYRSRPSGAQRFTSPSSSGQDITLSR